jgi:hypothetical protein
LAQILRSTRVRSQPPRRRRFLFALNYIVRTPQIQASQGEKVEKKTFPASDAKSTLQREKRFNRRSTQTVERGQTAVLNGVI